MQSYQQLRIVTIPFLARAIARSAALIDGSEPSTNINIFENSLYFERTI
jgi:hypothetical protein